MEIHQLIAKAKNGKTMLGTLISSFIPHVHQGNQFSSQAYNNDSINYNYNYNYNDDQYNFIYTTVTPDRILNFSIVQ